LDRQSLTLNSSIIDRLTLSHEGTTHCHLSEPRARHTKRHMNEGNAKKGPDCVITDGRTHERRLRIPEADLYNSPRFPSNTLSLPEPLWNPFLKSSPWLDTQSQAYTMTCVALIINVRLARCGRRRYRSESISTNGSNRPNSQTWHRFAF